MAAVLDDVDVIIDYDFVGAQFVTQSNKLEGSYAGRCIQFHAFAIGATGSRFTKLGKQHGMCFKMVKNETKLVKAICESYGLTQVPVHSSNYSLMWTGSHLKPYCLRTLTPNQRVNHFPRSYEITRKDRLYRNLERMQQLHGLEHFNFIPEFYVTPEDFDEFQALTIRKKIPWIVKPVGSSRGRGIFLAITPDQIPLASPMLVSKYIANPYTVNGHKFDIRLYVAVTSFHPLCVYLYQEGLARFASEKYNINLRTLNDVYVHLTNYSLNKNSKKFVRQKDPHAENEGHKWSLSALLVHLESLSIDSRLVMLRIEDLVIKTLMSAQAAISAAFLTFVPSDFNCFEIFGFDVLLDSDIRPWLLEVNLSPSLSCDAPIDFKIKSRMVCDLLTLAAIPIIKPVNLNSRPVSRLKSNTNRRVLSTKMQRRTYYPTPITSQSRTGTPRSPNWARCMDPFARRDLFIDKIKHEFKRMGNFVRIYPTINSWDLYNQFLDKQLQPPYDQMIHEALFPKRHIQPVDDESMRLIRRVIYKCDQVKSLDEIKDLSIFADIFSRCSSYDKSDTRCLKKLRLPELKKFKACDVFIGDKDIDNARRDELQNMTISNQRELSDIFKTVPPVNKSKDALIYAKQKMPNSARELSKATAATSGQNTTHRARSSSPKNRYTGSKRSENSNKLPPLLQNNNFMKVGKGTNERSTSMTNDNNHSERLPPINNSNNDVINSRRDDESNESEFNNNKNNVEQSSESYQESQKMVKNLMKQSRYLSIIQTRQIIEAYLWDVLDNLSSAQNLKKFNNSVEWIDGLELDVNDKTHVNHVQLMKQLKNYLDNYRKHTKKLKLYLKETNTYSKGMDNSTFRFLIKHGRTSQLRETVGQYCLNHSDKVSDLYSVKFNLHNDNDRKKKKRSRRSSGRHRHTGK